MNKNEMSPLKIEIQNILHPERMSLEDQIRSKFGKIIQPVKYFIPRELLSELYLNQNMGSPTISKYLNIPVHYIMEYIHYYDLFEKKGYDLKFRVVWDKNKKEHFKKRINLALSNKNKKEININPLFIPKIKKVLKELPKDFYNSEEWAKKRIEILKRDNFKCIHCGNPANHVDHINSAYYFPQLALDSNNLISSCENCHKKRQPRGKWK